MEPKLTAAEAKEAVKHTTGRKVTEASIKEKIQSVDYLNAGTTTICVINLRNGFQVIGSAGCADPANYVKDIGERYAYDDAFKKIWPLEGYLLREAIYNGA